MMDPTRLRRSMPKTWLSVVACMMAACTLVPAARVAAQQTAGEQAAAPASPAEPTPEQREAAREAYTRGQALFAQGSYAQAKAAFDEAYRAVPNALVLLSAAECAVRLGNLEDAYAVLQQYLVQRPDAPDRADVERKANDLLATPAHLVVSSDPVGAAIAIDGKASGRVTPAEIEVLRGKHDVALSLEGFEPASEPVSARIGARHELRFALHAVPPPTADLKLKPTLDAGKPTTALWITSIVGAAGLVTGTVLGFMVLADRSDYDANPTKAAADQGERLALFTDVAFGVGAMAAVTAAVLYLSADGAEVTAPGATAARLAIVPSAHGAGVIARSRF